MNTGSSGGALVLPAYAKLNIGLDIVGRRPDGYHELRMLMLRIALSDTVKLKRTEEAGIRLYSDMPGLPSDERNLAYRAAAAMFRHFGLPGGTLIRLEKKIPAAAGLAGGSADAAAVLTGIDRMYGLHADPAVLEEIALSLGADVPYCLMGRTALAEGIGEMLTTLPAFPHSCVVLAKPEEGISTKESYAAYDRMGAERHPDIDGLLAALAAGDRAELSKAAGNVLQAYAEEKLPAVPALVRLLKESGAYLSMMSGSGPTVFGLFEENACAEKALEHVRKSGLAAFLCRTETLPDIETDQEEG